MLLDAQRQMTYKSLSTYLRNHSDVYQSNQKLMHKIKNDLNQQSYLIDAARRAERSIKLIIRMIDEANHKNHKRCKSKIKGPRATASMFKKIVVTCSSKTSRLVDEVPEVHMKKST